MTKLTDGGIAFDELLSNIEKRREQGRQKALATLAAAFTQLASLGADRVVVTYDGYGDSGCVESVKAYSDESEVELDAGLNEQLAAVAEQILPLGWENDAGAFGELILHVADRRVVREHNWRIESCDYSEEEWQL
tara:strand:+ start:25539 stop:25943 length:405 start_codon:yes stop_codon:yes gene_type:complete